jgi:hypothetical protein
MVKQYPHFLFVKIVNASVQDGNWSESSESFGLHSVCREETNGKGSMINGADGKALVFSSNVYLPRGTVRIPEGTEVLITETNDSENGVKRIQGSVLKFESGQLNARIWI